MAEYSAEYLKNNSWEITPDFSKLEVFAQLTPGESKAIICEGYGFVKITNVNDICMLFFIDGSSKSYDELID